MSTNGDLYQYTQQVVDACNLHTASIFVCDRSRAKPGIKYLVHINISPEAQHSYMSDDIFVRDPFTDLGQALGCETSNLILGPELASARKQCNSDYWSFIDHFGIETVAASTRQLGKGATSIIGFHHSRGRKQIGDVPLGQLGEMASHLQAMVAAHMLQIILDQPEGNLVWHQSMFGKSAPAQSNVKSLSPREAEIASLVCKGRLNKEIAYLIGLTEYTVENHLRRIYRKFGVHNRTSLAAAMAGQSAH